MTLCTHEHLECPKHNGNFDCHSFCDICEGDQEYCPMGCEIDLDEDGYLIYVNVGSGEQNRDMKEFLVLTGELVRIVAKDEDEMWELLSNGEWEEVETLSEIQEVNDLVEE